MKHKENETYELIPNPDHDQAWGVRILEGLYNETILQFGAISFNEDGSDSLSFNFDIVSTPDDSLTTEDTNLQEFAGLLLEHIITMAIEDDELEMKEREN